MKKKNEISDILIKKYPETYTNGFINIEVINFIIKILDIFRSIIISWNLIK